MKPTFKLDTREFDRTMRRYVQLSSRDPKQITDTKGFFIARRATVETKKADKDKIASQLGRLIKVRGIKGKTLAAKPLLESIIRARIYRAGGKQPAKEEVRDLMRKELATRMSSIAFIKSGWLPAIKTLAPFAEKRNQPKIDRTAKQRGKPNGYAIPSRGGWRGKTIIANTAASKTDRGGFMRFGMAGLQAAFNHETRSMKDYILNKLRGTARQAGVKVR